LAHADPLGGFSSHNPRSAPVPNRARLNPADPSGARLNPVHPANPAGSANSANPAASSKPAAPAAPAASADPASLGAAGGDPASGVGFNPTLAGLDTVKQQVAALYQQAEASTQEYDATEERIARLQAAVASSSTRSTQLREQLASATGSLGRLAAEQYRDAGISPSMALVFSAHPDSYLERAGLTDRVATVDQQRVVAVLRAQQQLGTLDRESAAELAELHTAELQLAAHRDDIQARLAEARDRLDSLGAAERADVSAALARGDDGDGLGATVPAADPSLSSLLATITGAATANFGAGSLGALGSDGLLSSTGAFGSGGSSRRPGSGASGGSGDSGGSGGSGDVGSAAPPGVSRVVKAVATAYNELGKPYVWGATGPGQFDCSGLTQHVWAAAGVQLPRTSQEQANAGQAVPVSDIRAGDLVVYYPGATHIGIYVGHGLVIHAPRPGSYVQFTPLGSMPINKVVRPVA
jgi:peptidoglycan DL-endopeptidase CwlO